MKNQIPWKYSIDNTAFFFFFNIWRAGRQWKGIKWLLFNELLLVSWEAAIVGVLFLASFDGMTSGLMHFTLHSQQAVHGQPGSSANERKFNQHQQLQMEFISLHSTSLCFSDQELCPTSGLGRWDPCEVHSCKCGSSLDKTHKCSDFWWPTCERNWLAYGLCSNTVM